MLLHKLIVTGASLLTIFGDGHARRKSLLGELIAAHQRTKADKGGPRNGHASRIRPPQQKIAAEYEREQARQRREAERVTKAQLQEQRREERARQLQAAQAERAAVRQAKEQARQAAEQAREQRRQLAEAKLQQRLAEAEFRTEAVQGRITSFQQLLMDRARTSARTSRRLDDVFNRAGSDAFVAELQQQLSASVYPAGLRGSAATMYRPEARELLVEYELPRQDVIPSASGYRYVKANDQVQPVTRKDPEIKKLYGDLIARVTLRTLAEAFDIAPEILVTVVEVKRYVHFVPTEMVRAFYGTVLEEGAERGLLITTGGFSQASRQFAVGKRLILVDGTKLVGLPLQHLGIRANITPKRSLFLRMMSDKLADFGPCGGARSATRCGGNSM